MRTELILLPSPAHGRGEKDWVREVDTEVGGDGLKTPRHPAPLTLRPSLGRADCGRPDSPLTSHLSPLTSKHEDSPVITPGSPYSNLCPASGFFACGGLSARWATQPLYSRPLRGFAFPPRLLRRGSYEIDLEYLDERMKSHGPSTSSPLISISQSSTLKQLVKWFKGYFGGVERYSKRSSISPYSSSRSATSTCRDCPDSAPPTIPSSSSKSIRLAARG